MKRSVLMFLFWCSITAGCATQSYISSLNPDVCYELYNNSVEMCKKRTAGLSEYSQCRDHIELEFNACRSRREVCVDHNLISGFFCLKR